MGEKKGPEQRAGGCEARVGRVVGGGEREQCSSSLSIFLIILIKQLRGGREGGVHEAPAIVWR